MSRPKAEDAAVFYHNYIAYNRGESLQELMQNHATEIKDFYNNLPQAKADYAYAEGKWTLKDLVQHVTDAERVFCYRALRISRKDTTALPGFDENSYAVNANAGSRDFDSLKQEFTAVRFATDLLLKTLTEDQLQQSGTASNHYITVNALAFIIYGHLLHHKKIIEERYL